MVANCRCCGALNGFEAIDENGCFLSRMSDAPPPFWRVWYLAHNGKSSFALETGSGQVLGSARLRVGFCGRGMRFFLGTVMRHIPSFPESGGGGCQAFQAVLNSAAFSFRQIMRTSRMENLQVGQMLGDKRSFFQDWEIASHGFGAHQGFLKQSRKQKYPKIFNVK